MKRFPFILLAALGFFKPGTAVLNNLTCYQCLVETNDLCTEDDLTPCSNDRAYDVCVTILRKTVKDGFHIEKKCGLGPCSLDQKGILLLGFDHCDRSQNEFECMSCCKTNGCNKSGSYIVKGSLILILIAGTLISFL
uniref:Protein sleepless n=1 Tax=Strigamia maritima TaxID=126957 RepID=T1INP1_STRMM